MVSQTVALFSSFTHKLSTLNSSSPLLPLPHPPTFSCSSSLPTPCLKASYGGVRVLQASHFKHFKFYASPADEKFVLSGAVESDRLIGGWEEVPDVESNKRVQALGQFAVDEYNGSHGTNIRFIRVSEAKMQVVAGFKYKLKIDAEEGGVKKKYGAVVYERATPTELLSFNPLIGD